MKGYKVFNEEFWWREDCPCEVRETYESDENMDWEHMGEGFKFYQYFDSIFNDYRMSPKLRIYEVVAFGDIRHEYMSERTTKIKILRELQLEDYIGIDTGYSKLYAFLKYKIHHILGKTSFQALTHQLGHLLLSLGIHMFVGS